MRCIAVQQAEFLIETMFRAGNDRIRNCNPQCPQARRTDGHQQGREGDFPEGQIGDACLDPFTARERRIDHVFIVPFGCRRQANGLNGPSTRCRRGAPMPWGRTPGSILLQYSVLDGPEIFNPSEMPRIPCYQGRTLPYGGASDPEIVAADKPSGLA